MIAIFADRLQVLHGLAQIRDEGFKHHVSCANVLLSLRGEVKIGKLSKWELLGLLMVSGSEHRR